MIMCDSAGITFEKVNNIESIADDLRKLMMLTARRPIRKGSSKEVFADKLARIAIELPRHSLESIDKEFFVSLKRLFPQNTSTVIAKQAGELIGFTMNFLDGADYHSIKLSMVRDSIPEYIYRALLSEKVSDAINQGAKLIHFGRTCLETKSDFGAREIADSCYLRVRSFPLN